MTETFKDDTLSVHGGLLPDPSTLAAGMNVCRSSSFVFKNARHAEDLFSLKEQGYIYSRLGNPTNDVLEQKITQLEGGTASVAISSGTSAIFYAVINIAQADDEFVSSSSLYGGTFTMFDAILPSFGINARFADVRKPKSFEQLINAKTRFIYTETIGNPSLDVADLDELSTIAKKHGLPLVVDATFTTPALLKSIEHGADVVINSLTKWIGGHGSAIGGVVTDAGKFDWSDKRFELFNKPDKSYHSLAWAKDLPQNLAKSVFATRLRLVPLRNLGACLSPDNAWIFAQGCQTLHLRMARHCQNALTVARFLESHPKVAWVRYPGLESDPSHRTSSRLLGKGFGGMVVFGVKGGRDAGERFIDSLKLFLHLANVGDARSLALHPASTTHAQLTDDLQAQCGITADMIRLSVGLENADDIIGDLNQALAKLGPS